MPRKTANQKCDIFSEIYLLAWNCTKFVLLELTVVFVIKKINLYFFVFLKVEDVDHLLDRDQDEGHDQDLDQVRCYISFNIFICVNVGVVVIPATLDFLQFLGYPKVEMSRESLGLPNYCIEYHFLVL